MKLKLPIFHHSDETRSLDKLDIDYNIEDCGTQEIIFYRIDALAPAENNRYCSVFTGGEEFVCALSMKEVEDLIDGKQPIESIRVSYNYIVELFTSKSDTTHRKEIIFDGEPFVIDGHIFEFRSTRQLTNGEAHSRVKGTRGIKEIRGDIKK